jgi:hypothetical protein
MRYEADIEEILTASETLINARLREEGSRREVHVEEFDIVSAGGRIVGVLTARKSMDPSPPFHVHRTVTRR